MSQKCQNGSICSGCGSAIYGSELLLKVVLKPDGPDLFGVFFLFLILILSFAGSSKKLKISHFQKSVFWDFLRTHAKNQKMFFPKIKPHGEPDNLILHTQPAQTHLCGYLHKKPKSKLGFILFTYDLPNFLYQGRFHLASLGLKPPG